MPHEIRLWRVDPKGRLLEVEARALDLEERIEQWVEQDVSVLADDLLVIGRQVPTDHGGFIDLLCIDREGDLVIVELKRDKTPREVTAQTLDYASWVRELSHEEVAEIADKYLGSTAGHGLARAFLDRFGGYRPDDAALEPAVDSPARKAELDRIHELGERITTLATHIHAATQRLLELIADFDARRGWELDGHRSCAHWLAFRTGIDLGAAREKARAARALVDLPETRAAMARGELSFSQVRALTRVADRENEADLLELARGSTTAQLERAVRAWKRGNRQDEATRERERHTRRCLSIFPDDDGMYVVRGLLTPELGALLMRAVEAAGDALFREERVPGLQNQDDSEAAARRRRADALGLLAERAMSAGFGTLGQAEDEAPVSGTRAARYQVVLHVDEDTLEAEAEPGRSELEDGTRVSAETSRRLSCDAGLVKITHAWDGSVLDVGRRTRTIPPSLRRALEARDRGCRFPGCNARFTDAHHVKHWADGGETSLLNCVLLCRYHHRLVHEGAWQVDWWGDGRPVFFDPRGGTHFDGRWQPPEVENDVLEARAQENRARGADPDALTAGATWKRLEDVPDEVLFRAMEAVA